MSLKYIIISYGPVQSFNLGLEHRPQYVYGIRDRLLKLGYRVDLKPVQNIECFLIEMGGHEVFRCNIKNLAFNMSYKRDPVGQLALIAVKKAQAKLFKAREYLWLKDFTANFFRHLDHSKVTATATGLPAIGSIASIKTCADCCGIVRKIESCIEDPHRKFVRKASIDMHYENMSKVFMDVLDDENVGVKNIPSKFMEKEPASRTNFNKH